MKRFGLCLLAGLALASCGESAEVVEEDNEDATARGEVLGGTISDDMLPLDTLTSQAPSRVTQATADGDTASSGAEAEDDGAEQAPAPAAAPAPETPPEPPAPATDDEPAE
ncbi:hypothetical protein [Qipengyuania aquimaris]|uniref:Uncharacterized protein n=1 Tax=Qipengyuania aquimaris TaxID=255984 RepID=A0A9Q3XCP0_9SPHN|nr:hypothetical protein [Qipengyuania aquimaris]MBY6216971.1 hypothetical protein [Qipengyuania aquimaris]